MNILLVDHDSLIPNLALMKISSYHKSMGDKVYLNICNNPDKVYISCIFDKNKNQVNGIKHFFNCDVVIGGIGVNNKKLPEYMENIKPDYDLYNIDYSIGYTSKGCIRKCSFCKVPVYEGNIRNHHSIELIMNDKHDKLLLLDNNFLASQNYKKNLKYIKENNIKVNFSQGLDIRLINNENSKLLSEIKTRNIKFKSNQIHFAFDSLKYKKKVINGIKLLNEHGIKPYRLMFYVLVNYDSSLYEDFLRIGLLINKKVDPFIMLYSDMNRILNKLARFINRRIYKKCKFEEYKNLDPIQKIRVKEIIKKLPNEYRF